MEAMDALVVYVPTDSLEAVLRAVGGAGAGRLGNYSHCSFTSAGTGRFTPLPGARPAIGAVGRAEQVAETRIEAIYPHRLRAEVIAAMIRAHPYETPAFMTYPVETDRDVPDVRDEEGLPITLSTPVHDPTAGHRHTALVTGVGRTVGIGAGIARRLAADGWDLVLSYWSPYDARMPWGVQPEDVEELTSELEAIGASVSVLPADLQDPGAVARLMAAVDRPLHGLVLSHAESVDSGILDTSLESFERHFAVNARASWQLLAAFAGQVPAGGGAVVALTSDHTAHNLPYGASKGALDRIILAGAREFGHLGISCNVLNPGPVDTGWMDDALRADLTARQPTGRLGTPADIAAVAAFLLSPEGRWINGQLLKADGGFSS